MKESLKIFVNGLKFCNRNIRKLADEAFATEMQSNNFRNFCRHVRARKQNNASIEEIDGYSMPILLRLQMFSRINLVLFLVVVIARANDKACVMSRGEYVSSYKLLVPRSLQAVFNAY